MTNNAAKSRNVILAQVVNQLVHFNEELPYACRESFIQIK